MGELGQLEFGGAVTMLVGGVGAGAGDGVGLGLADGAGVGVAEKLISTESEILEPPITSQLRVITLGV